VIEEEASELETPASELTRKNNRKEGTLHRKQTSIMSSKRASSAGHPLEEEEEVEKKMSTFNVEKSFRAKVTEEQGGPIVNELQREGFRRSSQQQKSLE